MGFSPPRIGSTWQDNREKNSEVVTVVAILRTGWITFLKPCGKVGAVHPKFWEERMEAVS